MGYYEQLEIELYSLENHHWQDDEVKARIRKIKKEMGEWTDSTPSTPREEADCRFGPVPRLHFARPSPHTIDSWEYRNKFSR